MEKKKRWIIVHLLEHISTTVVVPFSTSSKHHFRRHPFHSPSFTNRFASKMLTLNNSRSSSLRLSPTPSHFSTPSLRRKKRKETKTPSLLPPPTSASKTFPLVFFLRRTLRPQHNHRDTHRENLHTNPSYQLRWNLSVVTHTNFPSTSSSSDQHKPPVTHLALLPIKPPNTSPRRQTTITNPTLPIFIFTSTKPTKPTTFVAMFCRMFRRVV